MSRYRKKTEKSEDLSRRYLDEEFIKALLKLLYGEHMLLYLRLHAI